MALQAPAVHLEPIAPSPTAGILHTAATRISGLDQAPGGRCRVAARRGAASYVVCSSVALARDPRLRNQQAWLELADVVRHQY